MLTFADHAPDAPSVFVRVPRSARLDRPLTVLVAIHGTGGRGATFAAALVDAAERNGWLLAAPDFQYRDWRDPAQVRRDGSTLVPALRTILESLPGRVGYELRPRVFLLGFSRGAQVAHRFAFSDPEKVAGVVVLSAGTYTLPRATWSTDEGEVSLPLPFGIADLEAVSGRSFDLEAVRTVEFFVGVGEQDDAVADSPPQWDPYLGSGRLQRAAAFNQALVEAGIPSRLRIFPGIGHEPAQQMLDEGVAFLRSIEAR